MNTIGTRIKERRISLGLSVDDIAAKLHKNRATVYRYESDEIDNLPISIIAPLAEILRTTPAYLMGWDEEEPLSIKKQQLITAIEKMTDEQAASLLTFVQSLIGEQE